MAIVIKNQISNIQILRAFAAIWVISFHTSLNLESDKFHANIFSFIASRGFAGVDIFFVISGYIMMTSQIMHPKTPTNFYLKRLIRIIPMYYFVTILYCTIFLVDPRLFATFEYSLSWLIASLTFTSGVSSFGSPIVILGWTLEFEMLFYTLLALTSLFFKKTNLMIAMSLILISLVLFGVNPIVLEFVFGMLAAYVTLHLKMSLVIAKICTALGFLALMLDLIMDLSKANRIIVFGIPAFLIVLGLVNLKQSRNQVLIALGNSSYSTYLVQILSIPLFFKTVQLFALNDNLGELLAWSCVFFTILCGHFLFGKMENYLNDKISQQLVAVTKKSLQ